MKFWFVVWSDFFWLAFKAQREEAAVVPLYLFPNLQQSCFFSQKSYQNMTVSATFSRGLGLADDKRVIYFEMATQMICQSVSLPLNIIQCQQEWTTTSSF